MLQIYTRRTSHFLRYNISRGSLTWHQAYATRQCLFLDKYKAAWREVCCKDPLLCWPTAISKRHLTESKLISSLTANVHLPIAHNELRNVPVYMQRRCFLMTPNKLTKPLSPKHKVSQKSEEIDDLQAILKDKSLGLTAKLKILFQQYGLVMIVVHLVTAAVWITLFYIAVSRGVDIIPFLERIGVFDFLERWGFSYAEKLKSSGASNVLMTYLLYEIAKPIRYPVTIFGTIYAVRYLRKIGFLKPPPKSATVSSLVQTQGKILRNRFHKTTKTYRDQYRNHVKLNGKRKRNGHGKNKT